MRLTLLAVMALALPAVASPPNIVLLSVDTLRADRLGCYGYELDTSPNIDRFAEDGLIFDDAVCDVPLTNPSMSAMLTGRYPRLTGAVRNGLPAPEEFPTVTEMLQAAGYETIGVQSNWTLRGELSDLDRGFDIYDDDLRQRRWLIFRSERLADDVTDVTLELLEERDESKPLFLWVHYTDPHAPYRHRRRFNPRGQSPRRLDQEEAVNVRYDSEVAFTDYHIGRLLDALPTDNTYILFVADHGESLYEHGYLGHGRRVNHVSMHIPLIIRGPGIEPGRTSVPAQGVDVGPTLLGFAGLVPADTMVGFDLINDSVPEDRIRVIETYGGAVPRLPGARAMLSARPPMRQAVMKDGCKLITGGGNAKLFHLDTDYYEEDDLAEKHPERLEELKARIAEWNELVPQQDIDEVELSAEDARALEAAGYL